MIPIAFGAVILLALIGFAWNYSSARSMLASQGCMHSIPTYHAIHSLLMTLTTALPLILLWLALQGPVIDLITRQSIAAALIETVSRAEMGLLLAEIKSLAAGYVFGEPAAWKFTIAESYATLHARASILMALLATLMALTTTVLTRTRVRHEFRARQVTEKIVMVLMTICSVVAVLTTIGIVASLLIETGRFLTLVPLTEFLFGLNWEPQIPMREDQVAAEGAFGWIPVINGTLIITAIAIFISVPIGLMSAIYLNEFAPLTIRRMAKPILEILAGVPTVVYGFFAVLVIAPAIRSFGTSIGVDISPNTALAAGGVMGIMLIPFISSFADDALAAVPRSLRDGSLALGATRAETMLKVLFPAAVPGIAGGILLAISRAIGETMIVVMAAGLIARLTLNPLDSVTTVTVQIVTLLIGDTSFDNPKTLAAFALGMMLFLVTLCINVLALRIVHRYREVYS